MQINHFLFEFLHRFAHQSLLLDEMIRFVADPLGIIVILAIAWYLLDHDVHKHAIWEITVFFGVAFFATGVAYAIKVFTLVPRPFEYFEYLSPLIDVGGAAFPSMHTTFYSALGACMVVAHPRSGIFVLGLALLIGISRVAAGIHWPQDILAGFILGSMFGFILTKSLYRWLCEYLKICIV